MRDITIYKKVTRLPSKGWLLPLAIVMALLLPTGAYAQISQSPLFLGQQIKPNIMFTMDNSGSMAWGSLTGYDGTAEYNNSQTTKAYYSSDYNQIYYNPAVTYTPAVTYAGVSMGNSDAASASSDAFPTGATKYTVDLTATCYTTSSPTLPLYKVDIFATNTNCQSSNSSPYTNKVARYAHYYVWDKSTNIKTASPSDTAFPTRVDIISTTATYTRNSNRTDCIADTTGATCSYAEEIQNFANWFSYYRTRAQMAKTSMGAAFAGIDPVESPVKASKFRVGFNSINGISSTGSVSYNNTAVADGNGWLTIRDFDSAQKQSFYSKLYAINPSQGTPLRTQMNRIGKLFAKTLGSFDYANNDPYRLSAADSTLVSCRASYHIMTTDGYWNDDFSGIGDQDGVNSGYSTRARGSYDANGASNTLADVALYYYKNDLRTDITNNVPSNPDDPTNPSNHQHVNTYTVGLGASGTLVYQSDYKTAATGDFAAIKAGTKNWPTPVGDGNTTIDDLWHAAVNGRGSYFSAKNPTEFQESLIATLKDIEKKNASGSAVALSANRTGDNVYLYAPSFESVSWLGHLKAYSIDSAGTVATSAAWDAATVLPAWNARTIATWVETSPGVGSGVAFDWANLNSAQQTALGSQNILEYLKGNGYLEKSQGHSGTYRDRTTKLGDIVNSAPLYVQSANFGYQTLPTADGGAAYSNFLTAKSARIPVIYVGANDGMLHAFKATTGEEIFAYMPNSVYSNLKNLSKLSYDLEHQYFVDGQVTQGDAYISGAWKNILLGSTGAGAKSMFAIDITSSPLTNPPLVSPPALRASNVLWEKSDSGDNDMGYMLGKAEVVQLKNGVWAAIYGNGSYSANQRAVLYLRNIATGDLIRKIDTGVGSSTAPNGLSTPALLFNSQRQLIAAYAGDLKGNLWKFDLSGASSGDWGVAYGGTPLFSATNASGQEQPIIQRPVLGVHSKGGYIVDFATGKYFDTADSGTTQIQTMYGIWDKPPSVLLTGTAQIARSELQQQTLTAVTSGAEVVGATLTSVSVDWTTKRGWYINLSLNSGERAIGEPVIVGDVLWVTSLVPVGTLCSTGGDSFLYGINYLGGGANTDPVFEANPTRSGTKTEGTTGDMRFFQSPTSESVKTTNLDTNPPVEDTKTKASGKPFRTWRQLPSSY